MGLHSKSAVSELLIEELAEVSWAVQPEERRLISRPTGRQISTHPIRHLNPNTYLQLGFWVNINDWLRSRIGIPRSLLPADLAKLF